MKPYIICCGSEGRATVFGYLESEPVPGQPVTIHRARMILEWSDECGGIFGLAATGPRTTTRITHEVAQTTSVPWQQSLVVSPEAVEAIDKWPSAGE